MALVLYQLPVSPPCVMVKLLAKQLGIELEEKTVNVLEKEHLKEDFLKINPQHTIPTMVDDGFVVTESRAILMYLVNKFGADNESVAALYPQDLKTRAVIDMRMCYDLSTLYVRFVELYLPVIFQKAPLNKEKMEKLSDAVGHINGFVKEGFVAGDRLTIADFSVVVVLSALKASGFDLSPFPEIPKYLEKCAEVMVGWEDVNLPGTSMFGDFVNNALAS